jgi:thiosulfate/3-mercaptopyruvate sulfurtransferase
MSWQRSRWTVFPKESNVTASLICLALLTHAEDKPYARPELLVEAAELPKLKARLLDARGPAKYAEGHMPGAAAVDGGALGKAFAEQQDPAKWTALIAPLGIAPDDVVVVYDDDLNREASRIWYILRYWGYKDVRLLNGGWKAWQADGGKIEKNAPKIAPVEGLKLTPRVERLTTKSQLLAALKDKPPQIVDARSDGEFCGTDARDNKRAGAVPGAMHLEWTDAIDKKSGKFKKADELSKILADAGIDPSKPAITYCQSGGRAAVMAFTLELMGGDKVSNYYRSWSEWGNDPDAPVVKPPKK